MLERVTINDKLAAIIVRSSFRGEGIQFFTQDEDTLQLGYMNRGKGYLIKPHIHQSLPRSVEFTNEVLFIRSGRVRINFYTEDQEFFRHIDVKKDDIVLLMSAGHGFEILEDSEIFEVKQGPYAGEKDKLRF